MESAETIEYSEALDLKIIGIADVEKAREPLFTGKPDSERSGMGFSIMESFMDSIQVKSRLGEGTQVKMRKTIGLQA